MKTGDQVRVISKLSKHEGQTGTIIKIVNGGYCRVKFAEDDELILNPKSLELVTMEPGDQVEVVDKHLDTFGSEGKIVDYNNNNIVKGEFRP
ncbi:unnamed protein product, partial [marine sediment metagenome]